MTEKDMNPDENAEEKTRTILKSRFEEEKEIIFRCEETGISAENLIKCAQEFKLTPSLIRKDPGTYLIRKSLDGSDNFSEIRCVIAGNVDAGKSTLLGVLAHCELDNGRGSARKAVLRHQHEKETGRTSSIDAQILGFDAAGNPTNQKEHGAKIDWVKICRQSSKIVKFYDLAGHEKYFKTTARGMIGNAPAFCLLVVGSNSGLVGMAKEHFGLAVALSLPVVIAVTKIDHTNANVIKETLASVGKLVKSKAVRRIPLIVQNEQHIAVCSENFSSGRVVPIFKVSSVTGQGLDNIKRFFNLVTTNENQTVSDQSVTECVVEEIYTVSGVGTVVSGIVHSGSIKTGTSLLLGPDTTGKFRPVVIRGIERNRLPVDAVNAGETATFALKKVKRTDLRKGMVLVSEKSPTYACVSFRADIQIMHHATTIKRRYQAVCHIGLVRQSAKILEMSKESLRTGDRAHVTLKFLKRPEVVKVGQKFIFRDGRTKAVGIVTERLPMKTAKL